MFSNLSLGGRLVLVVSRVERCKSSFVGLADLLELLHMASCGSKIHFSNL